MYEGGKCIWHVYCGNPMLLSWILYSMNKLWRSQKGGKWLVGGGEGIRFPFGCSHRHFHHCRQCREKSPLHGAPGAKGKIHMVAFTMWREATSQMRNQSCKEKVPDTTGPLWPRWVEWRCLQRRRAHPQLSSGFFSGWGSKTGPLSEKHTRLQQLLDDITLGRPSNEHQIVGLLPVRSEGTRYFFLSRSPILALGAFSTITWFKKRGVFIIQPLLNIFFQDTFHIKQKVCRKAPWNFYRFFVGQSDINANFNQVQWFTLHNTHWIFKISRAFGGSKSSC